MKGSAMVDIFDKENDNTITAESLSLQGIKFKEEIDKARVLHNIYKAEQKKILHRKIILRKCVKFGLIVGAAYFTVAAIKNAQNNIEE
jgi:hypothetical protein